jgi:OmpA-OmpF porin, OOP family
MTSQRSIAGSLASWGLALLLAGCSGWSFQPPMRGNQDFALYNLARLREAAPQTPTGFNQALTKEYAAFAGSLQDELKDWADTDYFSRKGLAAAHDGIVPPENNGNWLIPLEVPNKFRTELAQSRDRLTAALDGGGRDRLPLVAARAQARYDCWVERMEDDWKTAINGPCRKQFLEAMAELEGRPQPQAAAPPPAAPGREFRVYFEFDRAALLPEAQQILQQVAALAKQQPNLRIMLVGKADRAGGDEYNMHLSEARAERVRNALEQNGVARGRVETRWVGEREPPVPTEDGVREPRNRVVEINLR